jgi:hypothetical protein
MSASMVYLLLRQILQMLTLWGSTIRSPSLTWPDVVPSGVRPA